MLVMRISMERKRFRISFTNASLDEAFVKSDGMGIGAAVEPSPGSALIGLGVGAVLGAGLGYLGYQDKERKKFQNKKSKKQTKKKKIPNILPPEAQCILMEEKIEGTKYYGPQTICTIKRPAVWSR